MVKGEWFRLRISEVDFIQLSVVCNIVDPEFYYEGNSVWMRDGVEYKRLPRYSTVQNMGVRV